MPMNKEIAGESKWQIQVKLDIIGFTLFFSKISLELKTISL
ncbi:hypothetical protein BN890_38350 [Bacteroides xylanisolvens SD CC 1b]|uniref:Uncharacterized protein n=1 Tax=Bacteroides xylanisolvens SD CC 1b TaxID=702447 RepID=W6PEG0_9BACE|nr:hypothetical protein BN891_46160 [Bacteroides xylanisolvens SD CC 2a]CDM06232.1 hypothetical protein BN890_38350 [Bacteroides xylanisolvens SD CC 1b]